jgi:tyrosine decarboxylase/aspartate 1-decarboxylase
MTTTMLGSVYDVDLYTNTLKKLRCNFKLHIDAAFGGFYYPFSNKENTINFTNPNVSSFTLDAHKMAQAPYRNRIFIIKKNYIKYINTLQANYVKVENFTLAGSRSRAKAIAIWMFLIQHELYGWMEKTFILQKKLNG